MADFGDALANMLAQGIQGYNTGSLERRKVMREREEKQKALEFELLKEIQKENIKRSMAKKTMEESIALLQNQLGTQAGTQAGSQVGTQGTRSPVRFTGINPSTGELKVDILQPKQIAEEEAVARQPKLTKALPYIQKSAMRGASPNIELAPSNIFTSPEEMKQIQSSYEKGRTIFEKGREGREARKEYDRIINSKEGDRDYKTAYDLAFGKITPNFFRTLGGYGTKGASARRALYEKATQLNPEFNQTAFELGQYGTKAGIGALQRQAALVGSFEKTATINADRALALSETVKRSKYPMLNKITQLWTMDVNQDPSVAPELAAFVDANKTFATEYAKVTSGQTGGAAVSDSARKEFDALLRISDSPAVYRRRIQQMKLEMAGRLKGFEQQKKELMAGLPGETEQSKSLIPQMQEQLVQVTNPSGKRVMIKSSQLEAALNKGYTQ